MKDGIGLLIVDDHAALRDSLAQRISQETCLFVLGTAGSADEALAKAIDLNPDVILMDIDMPGLHSFEAVEMLMRLRPDIRVVFLSAFVEDHYIEQALKVKASGYLTKLETPETIVTAIREVASGGAFFSESVRRRIVIDSHGAKLSRESKSRLSTLTRREREFLKYVAEGHTKRDISEITHLSVKTVEHHVTRLMNKLNIHDRVLLTRFAIRERIINP